MLTLGKLPLVHNYSIIIRTKEAIFVWSRQMHPNKIDNWRNPQFKCPCIYIQHLYQITLTSAAMLKRLLRSIRLNKCCVCMHVCAISGKGLVIFGHWRRGAVTACGPRTVDPVFFLERGGIRGVQGGWLRNTLLWMSCYPAVRLWLTVGLNWMSEAVSLKSTTYQPSGLKSTLLVPWSVCFRVNPCRRNYSVPSVFSSLRTVFNRPAA